MSDLLWKLKNVTLSGELKPRLDSLSFEIHTGVTAIIGQSGAGKTSLLNLLCQFELPSSGRIKVSIPHLDDRLPFFWAPQSDGLWPHLTVSEHLSTVMPDDNRLKEKIFEILGIFDIQEHAEKRPYHLSQGERSRLNIARAVASGAKVLLLDEPLNNVNSTRASEYWESLRSYRTQTETSLVIATHSPEVVLREADRVICLDGGNLNFSGTVDDLYYRPQTFELANFLGPANWISSADADRWITHQPETDHCYRPEQITITSDANSPLIVKSSHFVGSFAEVELLDEQTGKQKRFYHRPKKNCLQPGDRAIIKICILLMFCFILCGCRNHQDPQLDVQKIEYWTLPSKGASLPAPRSMNVDRDDSLFILDDAGRVLVYANSGELIKQWSMPESEVGNPEGVCVFRDGRVAVADTHYHQIVFFDSSGNVVGKLGSRGEDSGQFIYPVAIVQDESENFYVGEYGGNDRIQKFTVTGKFILQFGGFGTAEDQFQRPSGLVWHENKIYVADAINNRIAVFTDKGKFLEILGRSENDAHLHYPYDLTIDKDNELYVVEYGAGRVTRLDLTGRVLGRFGETGRGENEFSTPWGLTINSQRRLFVADTDNRRIVEIEL